MPAQILSSKNSETQVLVTIQHGKSMLEFEELLQDELNDAGRLASAKQLEYLDTDGSPIQLGSISMTCKKKK